MVIQFFGSFGICTLNRFFFKKLHINNFIFNDRIIIIVKYNLNIEFHFSENDHE